MAISDGILGQFDHEMDTTRRFIKRYPEDKPDYKPHPKSATLGYLINHIAFIPTWGKSILEADSFDFSPPGGQPFTAPSGKTWTEILRNFEKAVAETREAVKKANDERWFGMWSLKNAGQTIFEQPRVGVFHGMVISHIIHHRAQLGVYYRLNDIPVPISYGPTADEPMGM